MCRTSAHVCGGAINVIVIVMVLITFAYPYTVILSLTRTRSQRASRLRRSSGAIGHTMVWPGRGFFFEAFGGSI